MIYQFYFTKSFFILYEPIETYQADSESYAICTIPADNIKECDDIARVLQATLDIGVKVSAEITTSEIYENRFSHALLKESKKKEPIWN